MKKVFVLQFVFILFFVSFISCEDSTTLESYDENNNLSEDEIISKKIENYKNLGKILLATSKNNEFFKELVYQECLKQNYGDYFIKIADLIELNDEHLFWNKNEVNQIKNYLDNLKDFTSHKPVLFVPSVEILDEPILLNKVNKTISNINSGDTRVVFKDEYDTTNHTCPGYELVDDNLIYQGDVDEDYAWNNNLWVIGDSEFEVPELVAENPIFGGGDVIPPSNQLFPRIEGRAEYGGIIQITDLNEVEHWISGKLEMRIIVVNSSGTVIKDESFPKRKRSRFKDNKWYDYNTFIANWNTSNIGNYMIEGWIERDGGGTTTISQTFSPPQGCIGCPSTTVTHNLGSWDDDLGKSIVQFSDNVGQVYGISFSNFKRK